MSALMAPYEERLILRGALRGGVYAMRIIAALIYVTRCRHDTPIRHRVSAAYAAGTHH